jgi:lantibiotic modifying enzyme
MSGPLRTLSQIVARASSLEQRFGRHGVALDESTYQHETATNRLARWKRLVAGDNPEAFARLLKWKGVTLEYVMQVLGSPTILVNEELPAWASPLREVLEGEFRIPAQTIQVADEQSFVRATLSPFVEIGWRRLDRCGAPLSLFTPDAQAALRDSLLARLHFVSRQVLEFEIERKCNDQERQLKSKLGMVPVSAYRRCGGDFATSLQQDRFSSFLLQYPVLAKMLALIIVNWVSTAKLLLQRLARDLEDLSKQFLPEGCDELGRVQRLATDLSDPHDSGQTVCSLEFESGAAVIYKPRSLGLDVAFSGMMNWWNETGAGLKLRLPGLIDRGTYGWSEMLRASPCQDLAAADRFLERAGLLLGLLYVLRGTDIHAENVLQCNEDPVIVDLEGLLSVPSWPFYSCPGREHPESPELHTVLSVGFLPRLEFLQGGKLAHDPTFFGEAAHQGFHHAPIVKGFEQMYKHVMHHREALLAPRSILEMFSKRQCRAITRRTESYGRIFRAATAPNVLTDGIDHSIELEALCRDRMVAAEKPLSWPILAAEQKALEESNVPYFATDANSTALLIGVSEPLYGFFRQPGFDAVKERISKLCAEDLARQCRLLNGTFLARIENAEAPTESLPLVPDRAVPSRNELIAAADQIARVIVQTAVPNVDDTVTWYGFQQHPVAKGINLSAMGESLYDGRCGPALFLATLDSLRGTREQLNLVQGSLRGLRRLLAAFDHGGERFLAQRYLRAWGLGAADGLGSFIYTLCKIGRLYEDQTFIEDAGRAAQLLNDEIIAQDRHLDVLDGVAGLGLGLLALHAETGESRIIELVRACGRRLVEGACVVGTEKTWLSREGKALTGFSHGAAGISYALLRMFELTEQPEFLAAAESGIAYEQSVFDAEQGNWPDYRSEKSGFMMSWCHGAPGIGLARLGGLSILETPAIEHDIEVAINSAREHFNCPKDDLCCGTFGLIELLLVAANAKSRPELIDEAKRRAASAVERLSPEDQMYHPGFFQGISGIGYGLLRLAEPQALPCVLLWE